MTSSVAEQETVTIPIRTYVDMKERCDWLDCLEAAGVDNWQGIEEAIRIHNESNGEQN